MATNFEYYSTIDQFLLKNIQCTGKNCNLAKYCMIRKYVNLRTFFNLENWLADKNQFFPCLVLDQIKAILSPAGAWLWAELGNIWATTPQYGLVLFCLVGMDWFGLVWLRKRVLILRTVLSQPQLNSNLNPT